MQRNVVHHNGDILPQSAENIGDHLLAGYAFHFSLIFCLLAALEVVSVFLRLDLHVVVQFYHLLFPNIVYLEHILAFQIGQRVLLAQLGSGRGLCSLIEGVLISHVYLLCRLHVSQIAEVLVLLQLEDPGLGELSLFGHQFEVVVETLPHLILIGAAEERMHLVVGQSIDLKQEAEGV